jgi:hypothetical protein
MNFIQLLPAHLQRKRALFARNGQLSNIKGPGITTINYVNCNPSVYISLDSDWGRVAVISIVGLAVGAGPNFEEREI